MEDVCCVGPECPPDSRARRGDQHKSFPLRHSPAPTATLELPYLIHSAAAARARVSNVKDTK